MSKKKKPEEKKPEDDRPPIRIIPLGSIVLLPDIGDDVLRGFVKSPIV